MAELLIAAAVPEDAPAICRLLASADLPVSDIDAASLSHFLVARAGSALAGVVGLEIGGGDALLRSLAVDPSARRGGMGSALALAAEGLAARRGVKTLYLLTTTAAGFFAGRGYAVADRAGAPVFIRGTTQFAGLCPSTAVFMAKQL